MLQSNLTQERRAFLIDDLGLAKGVVCERKCPLSQVDTYMYIIIIIIIITFYYAFNSKNDQIVHHFNLSVNLNFIHSIQFFINCKFNML